MTGKRLKPYVKATVISALIAAAATGYAFAADMPVKAPPAAKPVPFFFVNDTSVSFTWYFNATDPGVPGGSDVVPGGIAGEKNTFFRASGELDHFDVWEYGTNLIHIEADQYSKKDPVQGQPGATGAREFFAFSRSTIGWNELTHSKMFSSPLFNDIGFEVGGNYGSNSQFLAEQTTVGVFGLNFDIAIPKPLGTLLVGVMADKEFTFNTFNACGNAGFGVAVNGPCAGGIGAFSGNRDFSWTWRVETFYNLPLGFLGSWAEAAHIVNIANVIGPKGTGISTAQCLALGCFGPGGAFLTNETKTEVFEDVRLSVDTSKVFWGKPGIWDTYVGYRYWSNKFGTNHNALLFTTIAPQTSVESTAYVGTTYHFK